MELRQVCRFAEQAINSEHQRPEGTADALRANQEEKDQGFVLGRLSQSTMPCLSDAESSADSSDTSEGQVIGIGAIDQIELDDAISSTLQNLFIGAEVEETKTDMSYPAETEEKSSPGPQAMKGTGGPIGTPAAKATTTRDTPLGDQTTISMDAGSAAPARAAPAPPLQPTMAGEGSEGDKTLQFSPEQDISFAEDLSRRDTLGSRMSTLMRGLNGGMTPMLSEGRETKQPEEAAPRREGDSLASYQKMPNQVGVSGGAIDPQLLQRALHATVIAWQQRRARRKKRAHQRRGSRKRKGRRKSDTGMDCVKRRKLIEALAKDGMPTNAFLKLTVDIRIAVCGSTQARSCTNS